MLWFGVFVAALVGIFLGVAQIVPPRADTASLFPDNALLYIEARDFGGLLKDWTSSQEKLSWLKGDNYAAFSRSRLFQRLSQAQDEFSTAASLRPDTALLSSVAGTQSALALYDIGNLEFVYLTRMDSSQVAATPIWQVRDKFEQRTEGSAQFFLRQDQQTNRTAAFAARDGWLILATRADLIAGVLDRLQGAHTHSLPDEPWYAEAMHKAAAKDDDLRMIVNLEKIVPTPYFRSYWVQRNITEMKQYRSALCELHRTSQGYREDRILLRKTAVDPAANGDVRSLLTLVPSDAVYAAAQSSPDRETALTALRENLLELKPAQQVSSWSAAPAPVFTPDAGSADDLESRIDVAPTIPIEPDPYQSLRALLASSQLSALLQVYSTRSQRENMFIGLDRAVVLQSDSSWDSALVQSAMSAALRPGLTASELGIEWSPRQGAAGAYAALTGQIPLYLAVHGKLLFVSSSESLLAALMSKVAMEPSVETNGVTYAAFFQHTPTEQQTFRKLVDRLDSTGHAQPVSQDAESASPADEEGTEAGTGQSPPFFSGNLASLSRTFAHVVRESIEERDQGTQVMQTVIYQWDNP
jgi:hypothetical protein